MKTVSAQGGLLEKYLPKVDFKVDRPPKMDSKVDSKVPKVYSKQGGLPYEIL